MTDDEMEANALRYSRDVIGILPLSSGRIAVLDVYHTLILICDTLDEAKAAFAAHTPTPPKAAIREPRRPSKVMGIDLDDLDIQL